MQYDALIKESKYKGILINIDEETQKYETQKKEDIALMKLYFVELNEISNACNLFNCSFKRGRRKKNKN